MRPAVFHILLALADRDLHGLGIAAEVEQTTDGTVELGPATLYRSLAGMVGDGLIREVDPPPGETDPRRKYYRITPGGRSAASAEADRLARLVRTARARNLLPRGA